jgi:hypothetical protein
MQQREEIHQMQQQSLKHTEYFYNYALLTSANLSVGIIAACISLFYISKKV